MSSNPAPYESNKFAQRNSATGETVPLEHMARRSADAFHVAMFLTPAQSQYIITRTLFVDGGSVVR